MRRSGFGLGVGRLAAVALAVVMVVALTGDGGRAATVPATLYGQDPLEVLSLKVRPNVIVVLDSSGSMKWTLDPSHVVTGAPVNSGDHPRSKLWQAKQVLKAVVDNNQDKASFMFGQYSQGGGAVMQNRDTPPNIGSSGQNRFIYWTTDEAFPSMVTDELSVERALDDPSGSERGLQSWQVIHQEWGTLWFEEDNGAECEATLAGTFPKFYTRGGSGTSPAVSTTPQNLSFDLQTAMNNATCTGGSSANTYSVSYSDGQFRFTATGANQFRLIRRSEIVTNNISEAFGGYDTVGWVAPTTAGGGGGTTTVPISASYLRRRSAGTIVYGTAAHGLVTGDTCTVSGASPTFFNGTWTVTSIISTTRFWLSGPSGSTQWSSSTGTITCTTAGGGGPLPGGTARTETPHTLLFREDTAPSDNGTYDPAGWHLEFHNTFEEEVPPGSGNQVVNYQLRAAKHFNGEVIQVTSSGQVCGMTFPTDAEKTNPPTLTLQEVAANCGANVGDPVTFTWGGAYYAGGSNFCDGYQNRVALVPCDLQSPPAPTQLTTIGPWLENEAELDTDGSIVGYSERMDGTWDTLTYPNASAGGIKGYGSTPIAASLQDLKGIFTNLWNNGQAEGGAGPPPYALDPIRQHGTCPDPADTACADWERAPKEKTIVLFITDGDDTCAGQGSGDRDALAAALRAQELYERVDPLDAHSSVQTFVIGYGGGAAPPRLNWIAWGGSGLGDTATGQPAVPATSTRWSPASPYNSTLKALRDRCTTCRDAFLAPDAATLERQLEAIIEQGAAEGEFSAQQSVTESIFEYVDLSPDDGDVEFYADKPIERYSAIVPTRIISSFTMPGFRGRLRAIQNDGFDNPVEQWDAGEILRDLVADGMGDCDTTAQGGDVGECSFDQLHAGASDGTIRTSDAAIKRRIYTTERNGVYDFDVTSLMDGDANQRVTLWPPESGLAPGNYVDEAVLPGGLSFDEALGLPPDSPTEYPWQPDEDDDDYDVQCDPDDSVREGGKTATQCWLEAFKLRGACVGSNLPTECTVGSTSEQMLAARREAREITLAFMAGAEPVPLNQGIKRASTSGGGVSQGDILYKARSWVLGDSELATPAVVRPPLQTEPEGTPWLTEYGYFRDGVRDASGKNPDTAGEQIYEGFGLRNPDKDSQARTNTRDNRSNLKPLMTVVYSPANDMLHAFRAGPNITPSTDCSSANPDHECGGQEMWGFVPFDQLPALWLRVVNEPQGRTNHVYMLARGVRFSDVFVAAENPPMTTTVGGVSVQLNGVWRRVLYIPRGAGGKYVTALDVTGPGPYTARALDTTGPIPLWSRGNPDTDDGTAGGANNNSAEDRLAYSAMGQTWSMPTVAYRDKSTNTASEYVTDRRPEGVDYAIFMGSGYGGTGEGTTFYTLDALSGDVLADVDVEIAAAANGLDRAGLAYDNAIVANAVGFNPSAFQVLKSVHPAASPPERVYFGDVHGRLWKVLTKVPDTAIPIADLGADQPVGTAVSILGMPPAPGEPVPHIYVSAGNDSRAEGPFLNFGFRDDGSDTDTTIGTGDTTAGVTTYLPAVLLEAPDGTPFVFEFEQGDPEADCGYSDEAVFRGTIQPATAFDCGPLVNGSCGEPVGRVFFGGTRLNLPNTKYAPPTPLACGLGLYPCRSSFDSILYVLGAESGLPGYDLNAGSDDAYRIFRDNRISAISMVSDPDPTRKGSRFNPDEGKMTGEPAPPPPPGVPPTATTATPNVIMRREPGKPPPSVHYGSTVCQ